MALIYRLHFSIIVIYVKTIAKMNNRIIYQKLLKHPKWFNKRTEILKRDLMRCACCGSNHELNVHHKQYQINSKNQFIAPWQYESRYLITLCKKCHDIGHKQYNIPVFKFKNQNHENF